MNLIYWAKAGAWAFVLLMAVCAVSNITGAFLNMRPELYSVFGLVFVIGGCIGVIMRLDGMQVEKAEDYLKPKAVIVWLPMLLGLLFSIISTLTILGGLWMAMTFAIMNVYHRNWEQDHLKVEGDGHHHRSKN